LSQEKVCKFCGAIIRAEALYCDICGKKQPNPTNTLEIAKNANNDRKINPNQLDENIIESEFAEIHEKIKELIMQGKNKEVANKYQYLANLAFELGKEDKANEYIKKAKYFLS